MADFGDALGGAASGALSGFGVGGPLGAAIGGGIGLLGGLFSHKQQMQEYHDPYALQVHGAIDRMLNSNLGAQMATQDIRNIQRSAADVYNNEASNSDFTGNASVMSALYNKTQRTAQDSSVNAQLQGARFDAEQRDRGLSAEMAQSDRERSIFDYNQNVRQQNAKPGFFQNLLMQAVGTAAGSGLGKLMGSKSGGGTGDDTGSDTGVGSGAGEIDQAGITNSIRQLPGFGQTSGPAWNPSQSFSPGSSPAPSYPIPGTPSTSWGF